MIASKKRVVLLENAQIGILKELAEMKANHERRLRTIENQHGQQIIRLADKMTGLSSRLAAMEAKTRILEDALAEDNRRLKQLEEAGQ